MNKVHKFQVFKYKKREAKPLYLLIKTLLFSSNDKFDS